MIKIDKEYDGVRLDKYLRKKFKDIPLGMIFKYIRSGKIKVNGKKKKQDFRLSKGDEIRIFFEYNLEEEKPKFIKLSKSEKELLEKGILFENEDILVFNKPANLVVHKGSSHNYGLIEMLRSYQKNENINFVNRIDKATSGLVIAGKNLPIVRELSEYIRDKKVEKKYYALVHGRVKKDKFTIKNFLSKDEDLVRVKNSGEGKESISHFKVIRRDESKTLLEVDLVTGRTHQIRVQLAHMNHPIVGDRKYGKKDSKKKMCLFSHAIKIKEKNIDIDIPSPF